MKQNLPRNLFGVSGLYLDALRIFAAFTVVYCHSHEKLSNDVNPLSAPFDTGHAAVIVFFALSGFVIAHTTTANNRGGSQYAQARLSRLYSVLIPALLITAIVQFAVFFINPTLFDAHSRGPSWVRYMLAASFTNQLWFISGEPPINAPLWSLGYEFWYYAIFGLWFFGEGRYKLILPCLACLIAGPKILLLMPIWIAGCLAYQLPRPAVPAVISWVFIALSLFAAFLCLFYVPLPYEIGKAPLFYSAQFFRDNACGLFVALSLWLLPNASINASRPFWFQLIRLIGDLTFPLYVLHYPLLILGSSLFPSASYWTIMLIVIIYSMTIGYLLDKQRPFWIKLFGSFIKKQKLKHFHYVKSPKI